MFFNRVVNFLWDSLPGHEGRNQGDEPAIRECRLQSHDGFLFDVEHFWSRIKMDSNARELPVTI